MFIRITIVSLVLHSSLIVIYFLSSKLMYSITLGFDLCKRQIDRLSSTYCCIPTLYSFKARFARKGHGVGSINSI